MKIKGLFPTEYRTFTNGQLSIKVERYGNIDYIGWLEIRNFKGKNYPDRHGVHFFSRTHFQSMRMAPAINFFQEDENNQRRDFVPKNCELFPNGYVGDDSALKVKQNSFAMEFKPYSTRPFNILLRKNNVPTGQLKTLKNQIVQSWKSHCRFTSLDLKEMGISEDIPFPEDGKVEQELSSVSFDANNNVFVMELTRRDLWNTRKVYFALTGNNKSTFEEEALYWLLKVDCPALTENIKIGIGISFDKNEAISLAKSIILTKVIPETLQESNFALDFEDINGAATFANDYKTWQFAMLLGENDRECSIKAAAGKYGFFAMWDHIYPIRDFLMLGKVDIAKKALRYISTCYGVACYEWVGLHLPMVLNEILAYDEDLAFEEEIYNSLKGVYENFIKKSDEKTGLFPTRYSVGNDNSLQAGFSGEFFACCMNSWWYNSLCSMANIALDLSDLNAAKLFANQAKKVADNYLSVFYNFKDEYLRQAVTLDLTPGINVYQNTNTLGLDYTYGKDLLYKVIKNLANFQATKLYHATGHRAVPLDSEIPCEMWHSCHMNQHLGHECKLARMAGLPNEADRVMSAYLSKYLETGTAVETFNFTGCPGDQSQLSEWQTFSATGAVKGLVSGVAGIEIHRGGINYLPAFGTKYRKVYGLSIGNKVYNIDIVGEGNLGQLILNGQLLEGTLQLPIDVETKKENYLEFRRCNSTVTPLVFLQGEDIPIKDFVCNNKHISFTINANRFGVLRFYAQNKPVIKTSNENDFELTWNEQEHLFLWKGAFHKNQRIEVQL